MNSRRFQAANGRMGFLIGRKKQLAASAKPPIHTKPDCQLGSTSQISK